MILSAIIFSTILGQVIMKQPNESSATKEEVIQMLVSINESLYGIQSSCELTNFNILLNL
jgi:hypothetical protein